MKIILNNQFKTVHVSFYFIEKVEKDAFSYRFLLSRILTSYTDEHPTKKKLLDELSRLYGAYISNQIFILGQYHILRFTLIFPNPDMVEDINYENEILKVVESLFFNKNMFSLDYFNEAKRYTEEYILTKTDRKFEYAKDQLIKFTFKEEELSNPIYGSFEEVSQMTNESLYDYYKNYFLKNDIRVYVSGDVSDSFSSKLMAFEKYETKNILEPLKIDIIKKPYTHHEINLNMGQSLLFLSYYIDINREDPLFFPAQIATLILGGYPESVLFKKFREELMLAYDVEAHYEYDKKYLFIYAGVNSETADESFSNLNDIVNNLLLDGVTKNQVENAKKIFKNQIIAAKDSQLSYIPKNFLADLYRLEKPKKDILDIINSITIDDVNQVLAKFELTTSLIVRGTLK